MTDSAALDFRNIALVGHGGAGKTTLAEAILFKAKVTSRQGRVADRNTVSDYIEDEKERGHSIDSSLLLAGWNGKTFQIVDTPGYPDFLGQALRGLDAADLAVLVVNAYDGIALNTIRMNRAALNRAMPRVVVVNRCDMENIDPQALRESLAGLFGRAAKAVTLPTAWGAGFRDVRSIFRDAPEDKEAFVESAVEADDALMEKYLETGGISDEDLRRALPQALLKGTLVPVFHLAAEKGIGVADLMDFLADFGPSPLSKSVKDVKGGAIPCSGDAPLVAVCFKVQWERQAGKISFFRVLSGTMRHGDQVVLARTQTPVKVGHLIKFNGSQRSEVEQAGVGDLVALLKAEEVHVGDTLHAAGHELQVALRPLPRPMVGLAVEPKARGDEAKIGREIGKLTDGDPCLLFERPHDTHELVLKGMSTLHLDVNLKRLARVGIEVVTHQPKIPYRETITGKAEGHYRHKKQTGGAGQFGEVFLKVEPRERGDADPLEFIDETFGGSIPNQFLPAIEKGIRQKMAEGVIAGYPVVDVRVMVTDGKYHDVDSKEIAFIIAGRGAFSDAVMKARPGLLEPMVDVEVEIPSRCMGDITSDLNARRGRITGMDSSGDMQIIRCHAPLAEMQTYSTQLRSITGGEGSFSMEFSRYEVVPANLLQQIVARAQANKTVPKAEE
ncbi:MAG: elongation factor G [Planctomycetaceae bacterium]